MADIQITENNEGPKKSMHRNFIIVESLIFATTGFTSFLSLIFIPRSVAFFLTLSVLNGFFSITFGICGLALGCFQKVKVIKILWALAVIVAILNLISCGSSFYLLIQHIKYKVPDCSECRLKQFLFVLFVGYYIFQVIFDIFLAVMALFEIKHSYYFRMFLEQDMINTEINNK